MYDYSLCDFGDNRVAFLTSGEGFTDAYKRKPDQSAGDFHGCAPQNHTILGGVSGRIQLIFYNFLPRPWLQATVVLTTEAGLASA